MLHQRLVLLLLYPQAASPTAQAKLKLADSWDVPSDAADRDQLFLPLYTQRRREIVFDFLFTRDREDRF